MGKRIICMLCVSVIVIGAVFGIKVFADTATVPLQSERENMLALARPRVSRKPNPLASAMFLVLAGVGVSMLFDKKR